MAQIIRFPVERTRRKRSNIALPWLEFYAEACISTSLFLTQVGIALMDSVGPKA